MAEIWIILDEVVERRFDVRPRSENLWSGIATFGKQPGGIDAAESVCGFVVAKTGERLGRDLEIFAAVSFVERRDGIG